MSKLTLTIKIPDWTCKLAVFALLLYRRLRFGYPYRKIPLTQGKSAIVDPDDYERLIKYKWYVSKAPNTCYAIRGQWSPILRKRLTISMHRLIIDIPPHLFADHINRNGLDNRKANLRPATPTQNTRNARYKPGATSRFRGVWLNEKRNKFRSCISVNRKKIHLGYFDNETDAARAYDSAAKKYHKEFAVLNFK